MGFGSKRWPCAGSTRVIGGRVPGRRLWTGSITLGLFFAATAALADPAYGPWGGGIAAVLGWLISRNKRMKPG
jgi:hypothetical protein